MSVIWKYPMQVSPFAANGGQVFQVPAGAIVRHCGVQEPGVVAVWMEIPDTSAATEERWFRYFGTGFALQGDDLTYLGTALFLGGAFVLHVYEAER